MREPSLWKKIEAFELDKNDSQFTFSQRLARDNRWTHDFAKQVIIEYKKFIYLCCTGYGEITPSDAVDQAWHLHLTYTKSYWVNLCRNTLGMMVHHNPTAGGEAEKRRYSNDYNLVRKAYLEEFGYEPPHDIWPSNKDRFSAINYKRINLSDYWLIKKPGIGQRSTILFPLSLIVMLFIQSDDSFPWVLMFFAAILFLFVARAIKGEKRGKRRRRGDSSDTSTWWDDFWGCSGDSHSGCSSHGCSGCGGCGGGGD